MPPITSSCGCTPEQVDLMFKHAEQYIDEQIADRSYQMNRFWVDLYPTKGFPDGAGLNLQKVRFFGDIGPQYDGHDGWRVIQESRPKGSPGATAMGENDACGYVWEEVGHGMETVEYSLMKRDLRTKPICVEDIRTFWQYQEMQNLIFRNLSEISANVREQLNRNSAMMFSPKHIALPGFPLNKTDPFELPVIPSGVEVGKLTYPLLLQFFHPLISEAAAYALGTVDGGPAFGVVAHPETLFEMYYADANLRKDLQRCQGTACDLIKRYNFLDGIGPFILMPDTYAPRYDRDANGVLQRVFPFTREVPIELGNRPATNPAYYSAEFELVQFMTRDRFTLRTRRPITSVGGETDFDAEVGLFSWKWHNPPRCEDPWRLTGRYVTKGTVGVEPGDYTEAPAILVKRRPGNSAVEYWSPATNPPTPITLTNVLDQTDTPCPCPVVLFVGPAAADDELIITFGSDTALGATDDIDLETASGGTMSGTVEEASDDGTRLRVSFSDDITPVQGMFVGLACNTTGFCSAKVLKTEICGIFSNTPVVTLTLNRPLIVDTGSITLNLCDGTQKSSTLSSVNEGTLEYVTGLTWADYCAGQGVCSVCVPTATESTCPACDDSEDFEECTPPEEEEPPPPGFVAGESTGKSVRFQDLSPEDQKHFGSEKNFRKAEKAHKQKLEKEERQRQAQADFAGEDNSPDAPEDGKDGKGGNK